MELGDRIRKRRIELGLSQEELAKRMGLRSKSTICKLEKTEDNITVERANVIAKALETTPAYILVGETDSNDNLALTEEEKRMVKIYRACPKSSQKIIQDLIRLSSKT